MADRRRDGATPADEPEAGPRPPRSPRSPGLLRRRVLDLLLTACLALVGATIGVVLFGSTRAEVGPFDATFAARPDLDGGTEVHLPPLGRISLDSHAGPLGLDLRVDELRPDEAEAIAEDPRLLEGLEQEVDDEVRAAVRTLGLRIVVSAIVGAVLLTALRRFRPGDLLAAALIGALVATASIGIAARSWRSQSLAEPRYSGVLALAPRAVGDAQDVLDRLDDYSAQLAGLVENVAVLYRAGESVQSLAPGVETVRVLHVSDIHLNPQAFEVIEQIVDQFAIDVVVDTGDINDWGTVLETRFVELIEDVGVPYVYVRGNHDSRVTAAAVGRQDGAVVLDDDTVTVAGIRFWGIGDPRFTPDKSRAGSGEDEQEVAEGYASEVAELLSEADDDEPVDIALVHDPAVAEELGGVVDLVLAGHTHEREVRDLGDGTELRIEGSTGGAGLRALERDEQVPLQASVLHLDAEDASLRAVDGITVGGITQSDVRIEREVIDDQPEDSEESDDGGG
jgi:predicted phosphodiesterase